MKTFRGAVSVCALLAAGCTTADDEGAGLSTASVGTVSARVARAPDGAFSIDVSVPARVSDCAGAACADLDRDGLVDAWEDAVLDRLRPAVTFDEDEPIMQTDNHDTFAAIARVSPRGERLVVLSVLLLYTRDYGAAAGVCFDVTAHMGDAERSALELELTGGGGAIVRGAYTTGHEGTALDQTTIVRGADLRRLEHVTDPATGDPRWRVYSSQAKHATYLSKKHCEDARPESPLIGIVTGPCAREDCAPDDVADPERFTRLPQTINVGEREAHRPDDLAAIGFAGLRAWSDEPFCGGVPGADPKDCPSPLAKKLVKEVFDR